MQNSKMPARGDTPEQGAAQETQDQGTHDGMSSPGGEMQRISANSSRLWSNRALSLVERQSLSTRGVSATDRIRQLEDLLVLRNRAYPLSSSRGLGMGMLNLNRTAGTSHLLSRSMLYATPRAGLGVQEPYQSSQPREEFPAQKPSSQQQADTKQQAATKVPCRARGMPTGHDFEHAYFMLPADIKHGEELNCSHPGCRAEGTKFCYCAYCKTPVAKRNFRVRHHHFDEDPPVSGVESNAHQKMQKGLKAMSPTKRPIAAAAGIPSPSSKKSKLAPRMLSQTKRQANNWDRLLGSRPPKTDKDAMAKWIEQVFIASSSYQHPRDDEKEESDVPDPPTLNTLIESALQDEKDDSMSLEKDD